jgi:hypothetical protein
MENFSDDNIQGAKQGVLKGLEVGNQLIQNNDISSQNSIYQGYTYLKSFFEGNVNLGPEIAQSIQEKRAAFLKDETMQILNSKLQNANIKQTEEAWDSFGESVFERFRHFYSQDIYLAFPDKSKLKDENTALTSFYLLNKDVTSKEAQESFIAITLYALEFADVIVNKKTELPKEKD